MTNISVLINFKFTLIGEIKAAIPSINAILQMLEPTILPNDIPALPLIAEATETTNSGALVPKATIVNPTTKGVMPLLIATEELPLISPSAPKYRNKPPARRPITEITMELTVFISNN